MTYVQALYGGGGWPLSVFLSTNLKPLMGGTYFPPDDKYGRPGFKTVLRCKTYIVGINSCIDLKVHFTYLFFSTKHFSEG